MYFNMVTMSKIQFCKCIFHNISTLEEFHSESILSELLYILLSLLEQGGTGKCRKSGQLLS